MERPNYSTKALAIDPLYVLKLTRRNRRHIITFLSSLRGRHCWSSGSLSTTKEGTPHNAFAETWIFSFNGVTACFVRKCCGGETSQAFSSRHPFHRCELHQSFRYFGHRVGLRLQGRSLWR